MEITAEEQAAVEGYVRRVHGADLERAIVALFDAGWAESASLREQLELLRAVRPELYGQLKADLAAAVEATDGARGVAALGRELSALVQPVIDAYQLSPDRERVDAWAGGRPSLASDVRRTHALRCELAMDAVQRAVRMLHRASELVDAAALHGPISPDFAHKRKVEIWALPQSSERTEPAVRARVFEYCPQLFATLHRPNQNPKR
ncbi:hypothetical protein T492DRAFT_833593 [Pavlovales sp. CCMP2436]|nr:hypothetical protein T492DRAFT_833593 [Pavlovales sp. CCMP2436]